MEKLRILVLADLPDRTRHERKVARELREWLFSDGYTLLQAGVFTRVADGRDNASAHLGRLREHRPETGTVRVLVLAERQFQNSELVAGTEQPQETEVNTQLDIFL